MGYSSPLHREAKHCGRGPERGARKRRSAGSRADRQGHVRALERRDHRRSERRQSETRNHRTTFDTLEGRVEWYEVLDVTLPQIRISGRDSPIDPYRVSPIQDEILDPVVEMSLRRFRGPDVGRAVDTSDNAVQGASFSREHRDECACQSAGVREGHAIATFDLVCDRTLESADERVDVARRRPALTRRTWNRRRGVP